ncbi:putative membrane protein [Paenibacillus phyllosphaerae]|uniref:Putative membrane protein n=1 Tax=Paenibacillus phyllosphaerae TaxID=274593 RepID=A0A7W5AWJ1_9BACL|nr:hypothetical protein [Paenibacillus phyllosphaerae]MBB3109987.1 putative membrane protein [Paenibacillus phyllosphaerae]
MGVLAMIIIYFILGALVVKVGIDNSKNTHYVRELLEEVRELKEIIKQQNKREDYDDLH